MEEESEVSGGGEQGEWRDESEVSGGGERVKWRRRAS